MAGNRNKVFPAMSVKRQPPPQQQQEVNRRRATITKKWDSLEKELRANQTDSFGAEVKRQQSETMSTSTFDDGSSTSSSYLTTPSPMVVYPRGNRAERRKITNAKTKKKKDEVKKKEKEKDPTSLLVDSLQSSLDKLDRFVQMNLQDEIFLARKDLMPKHFEKSEKLRKRWKKLEQDLVYEELLVTIKDAKDKKRSRTKEAFKRELYCLLKTGSNPLTPIGEEPEEKGSRSATSNSQRLSPEGASSHDNDAEHMKSKLGKGKISTKGNGKKGKVKKDEETKEHKKKAEKDEVQKIQNIKVDVHAVSEETSVDTKKKKPTDATSNEERKNKRSSKSNINDNQKEIVQRSERKNVKKQSSVSDNNENRNNVAFDRKSSVQSKCSKISSLSVIHSRKESAQNQTSSIRKSGSKVVPKVSKSEEEESEDEEEDDDEDDDDDDEEDENKEGNKEGNVDVSDEDSKEEDDDEEEDDEDEDEDEDEDNDESIEEDDEDESESESESEEELGTEKEKICPSKEEELAQNEVSERDSVSQCSPGRKDSSDEDSDAGEEEEEEEKEEDNEQDVDEDDDDNDDVDDDDEDDDDDEEDDDEEEDDEEEGSESESNGENINESREQNESKSSDARANALVRQQNVCDEKEVADVQIPNKEVESVSPTETMQGKSIKVEGEKTDNGDDDEDNDVEEDDEDDTEVEDEEETVEDDEEETVEDDEEETDVDSDENPADVAIQDKTVSVKEETKECQKDSSSSESEQEFLEDSQQTHFDVQITHTESKTPTKKENVVRKESSVMDFGSVVTCTLRRRESVQPQSCSNIRGDGKGVNVVKKQGTVNIEKQNEKKRSTTPETLISDGAVYIHRPKKHKKKERPPSTPHSRHGKRNKSNGKTSERNLNPTYDENPYIATANDIRRSIDKKERNTPRESRKSKEVKSSSRGAKIPKMFSLVDELKASTSRTGTSKSPQDKLEAPLTPANKIGMGGTDKSPKPIRKSKTKSKVKGDKAKEKSVVTSSGHSREPTNVSALSEMTRSSVEVRTPETSAVQTGKKHKKHKTSNKGKKTKAIDDSKSDSVSVKLDKFSETESNRKSPVVLEPSPKKGVVSQSDDKYVSSSNNKSDNLPSSDRTKIETAAECDDHSWDTSVMKSTTNVSTKHTRQDSQTKLTRTDKVTPHAMDDPVSESISEPLSVETMQCEDVNVIKKKQKSSKQRKKETDETIGSKSTRKEKSELKFGHGACSVRKSKKKEKSDVSVSETIQSHDLSVVTSLSETDSVSETVSNTRHGLKEKNDVKETNESVSLPGGKSKRREKTSAKSSQEADSAPEKMSKRKEKNKVHPMPDTDTFPEMKAKRKGKGNVKSNPEEASVLETKFIKKENSDVKSVETEVPQEPKSKRKEKSDIKCDTDAAKQSKSKKKDKKVRKSRTSVEPYEESVSDATSPSQEKERSPDTSIDRSLSKPRVVKPSKEMMERAREAEEVYTPPRPSLEEKKAERFKVMEGVMAEEEKLKKKKKKTHGGEKKKSHDSEKKKKSKK